MEPLDKKNDDENNIVSPITLDLPRAPKAYASLTLGILALIFGFILCGWIPAYFGLRLGRKHLREESSSVRIAKIGVAFSIIGFLFTLTPLLLFCVYFFPGLHHVTFVDIPNPLRASETKRVEIPVQRGLFNSVVNHRDALNVLQDWIGVPAPDIEWRDAEGNVQHLSDFKGKKIVLSFFEQDSKGELESPNQLVAQFKDVSVIGLFDYEPGSIKFINIDEIKFPVFATKIDLAPDPYFLMETLPIFFVIDHNGIIHGIFDKDSPYETIAQLMRGSNYTGKLKTSPPTIPRQPGPALTQWTMEKAWESDISSINELEVCDWDADSQDELFARFMEKVALCDEKGKIIKENEYIRDIHFISFAVGRVDKELYIAFTNFGTDTVTVMDFDGKKKWTTESIPTSWPHMFWADLDGDDKECLIVSDKSSGNTAIYESDGTLRRKCESVDKPGISLNAKISQKFLWSSQYNIIYTPVCVIKSQSDHISLLATSNSHYSSRMISWLNHKLKPSNAILLNGWVSQGFNEYVAYDINGYGDNQIGLINHRFGFEPDRTLLFVLDNKGKLLWKTSMKKPFMKVRDGISMGDFDGDGIKEWVLFGSLSNLLLISPDGKILFEKPLSSIDERDISNTNIIQPKDNLETVDLCTPEQEKRNSFAFRIAPGKDYQNYSFMRMRVLPRPAKGDLLLLPSGKNWIAYTFKH
ncbi:MAG TPA: redoxin domain-containing protein [Candidatus Hydrogenedentes bacterium]|nr:redoxin domain-containing protein [Candidatus Hydrogenedentota bacterium]